MFRRGILDISGDDLQCLEPLSLVDASKNDRVHTAAGADLAGWPGRQSDAMHAINAAAVPHGQSRSDRKPQANPGVGAAREWVPNHSALTRLQIGSTHAEWHRAKT